MNAGIKTRSLDSNVTIRNNIIQNNDVGIFLNYAYEDSWNIVNDNFVLNNRAGMYIHWANNNEITGNIIKMNAGDGIEMECSQYSTLTDNLISGNGECGLYLIDSSNGNTIKGINIIANNSIGVKLDSSHINIITGNNFINNSEQAYFINSFLNRWNRNYWDDWPKLITRMIQGNIGQREIRWVNFDWFPYRQPY